MDVYIYRGNRKGEADTLDFADCNPNLSESG